MITCSAAPILPAIFLKSRRLKAKGKIPGKFGKMDV